MADFLQAKKTMDQLLAEYDDMLGVELEQSVKCKKKSSSKSMQVPGEMAAKVGIKRTTPKTSLLAKVKSGIGASAQSASDFLKGPASKKVEPLLTSSPKLANSTDKTTQNSTKTSAAGAMVMVSPKPVVVKKLGAPKTKLPSKVSSGVKKHLQMPAQVPPPPNASDVPPRPPSKRVAQNPVKYFTDDEQLQEKLVGVVIMIFEGSSYDAMFREVKPTTVPGERVSTYSKYPLHRRGESPWSLS